MGRPVKAETIVFWLCVALVAIAGLAPIAAIAVESFRDNGHFSLNYYRELISAARFWPLLGNSIRLALATTAVCGLIGVPAGILFAKSDLPMRSGFIWLLTVPFVLPPYFVALGWARVVARIGQSASDWLFGFGGCVLVLSSVFLPLTMLLTFASSSNVDRRLEEAARLVSGWPGVLRRVTLPLSAPGIVFSLVLVFLLAMGELSVPSFLRYPVLPVLSFTQFTASYNFSKHWPHFVHLTASLEDSFGDSHGGVLFRARHSSVECSVHRRVLAGRNARSDATRRGQRRQKCDVFGCSRNDPDGSRISARPRDAVPSTGATNPQFPDARAFCNSGNGVIHRTGPPLEYSEHVVHLRDTSSVDSRVHRTILRRDNEVIAGGTDADSQIVG